MYYFVLPIMNRLTRARPRELEGEGAITDPFTMRARLRRVNVCIILYVLVRGFKNKMKNIRTIVKTLKKKIKQNDIIIII